MSAAGSSGNNGNDGGRRPFFNDRRFTVAGPQRLRQNVQDLLSQFNRQFAAENPSLLHDLADQLNRLQDLLGSNPNGNNQVAGPNQVAPVHEPPPAARQVRIGTNSSDGAGPSNSPVVIPVEHENRFNRFANDADTSYDDELDDGNQNIYANNSVVLNMEAENGEAETNQDAEAAPAQQQQQDQGTATNPDADIQRLVAALRAPEMQRIIQMVLNFGPFVFILLMKWMLTYASGIVMLLSLLVTFFYAENVLETVIASSRTQQTPKWRLMSTMILLLINIGALYFFFASDNLYQALLFQPTLQLLKDDARHLSFLTLLWLVITTDFVVKFIFMMTKCLVVSGPTLVSTHRRKAQTYQWLEYTSHMYRHWLPTLPWAYYLTATSESSGYVTNGLCTILFLGYLLLKIKLFRPKVTRWWKSTMSLLRPTSFGYSPSTTELMKTGPTCSICYGEYTNPVQLSCKHIFCEECVTTWLDKQKTCPMCRTQVITGDNDWKDGKTSYCVQLV